MTTPTYKVNLKICEGVTWDKATITGTELTKNSLVKDAQNSKWQAADGGMKGITDAQKKTTEAGIANCRYWYDEQKHDKAFCCQLGEMGTLDADKKYTLTSVSAVGVYAGKKTSDAAAVDTTATMRMVPGAETFNGAVQMAATAAFAAVMTMY